MVKNAISANDEHVKFISYTGEYPNLCSGILTLKIDGVEVRFGHDPSTYDWANKCYRDGNFNRFWTSGGCCGFNADYTEEIVESGEWEIDAMELPYQFREYVHEIDAVFNENVPYGCCGGCL